ncbi:carbohydrate ABC transporter permease [Dactylosporangium aurantiacum]|uniref:carbohydrate ABC transporter permease n=1 Tax=Dactylosporangium aurantiacum TaxID=35754 RepID=UPI001FDED753|nr:carbohydrate ABC transporter permease [Dactylosporangium aurantiacum]MDG6107654.1 carbohydrate ABC transporter permease [Dactylosporangium aurantiacum]
MFVLPMLWALASSFKPRGDIFGYPPSLVPDPFTLDNYTRMLDAQPFWSWFAISTVVAVVSTAVAVFVCSLAGFAFAKYRFRGKNVLFNIMFSSLTVPFAVIVVPLFVMLVKTGLNNPWFALIVPWLAPAFGIFMMRQYVEQSVPDEILESARVDGASEFRLFLRIVMPLLRPALGALAVWSFLSTYNSFFWPLIVVGNDEQYTLPLGIQSIYAAEARQVDLVLAASVLAAIPSLLLFTALRKQLLEGLTAGAVKH